VEEVPDEDSPFGEKGPRTIPAMPIRPFAEEIPDEEAFPIPRSAATANRRHPNQPSVDPQATPIDSPVRVIRCTKARTAPPGKSALGITALSVYGGRLGSLDSPEVQLRLDSGADITLISEDCYKALQPRPKLQKGMKLSLFELTNQAKILGYVNLPIYITLEDGRVLEFTEEAYVIPEMNVPVLLGEDFQVNYEVSVHRTAQGTHLTVQQPGELFRVQAYSSPPVEKGFRVQPGFPPGVRDREAYLAGTRSQKEPPPNRQRDRFARAARDVRISPGHIARIPFYGATKGRSHWFVERITIQTKDGCFLAAPSSIVNSGSPTLDVANTSPSWKWIRKGDVLGILHDPDEYLDCDQGDERSEHLKAYANVVQKIARGSLGDQDLAGKPLGQTKAGDIPPEPDGPDELWGPKTSEPADPTTYDSKKLEELIDIAPDAPEEIRRKTLELVRKHINAFGFDDRLGTLETIAKIRMKPEAQPVSVPMYGASPAKRQVIDEQMDKWIKQEVIEPSKSPWSAPVVIAYRNGKPRFCVDYRKLNAMTVPDEFPIPRQKEILQALSGSQVLSALDALAGFHQMFMDEEDREKTSFRSHWGLWQFIRMPFGLRNGPSIFQRMMQSILAPYLWIFALVYIDDIVIYSKSYEEHLVHLDKVLQACSEANLTLAPKKCHFMYTSILLLGQKVSRLGLSTHHEKVKAVLDLARPHNKSTLQTFLGMAVYFSHFIPHYSDRAAPLFALLRKDVPWSWQAEQELAFEDVKNGLVSAPILGHPMPSLPYRVYSDASDVAIGASLQQVQPLAVGSLRGTKTYDLIKEAQKRGDPVPQVARPASKNTDDVPAPGPWAPSFDDTIVYVERVIAYWSRSLKSAERNYSATEREALGVKEALVRFQPFIEGEKNIVITDHAALQWARTYENANRRLAAWGAVFGAYPGLDIVHRAGIVHSNVDPLSRLRTIPPHQSPVEDNTAHLPGPLPDPPVLAWEEGVERVPAEKAAFLSTRAQVRSRMRSPDTANQAEEPQKAAPQRSRTTNPPTRERLPQALTIAIGPERLQAFVQGYEEDPSFKRHWEEAAIEGAELEAAQRFYRSDNGLLLFRDADWVARLCVPQSETRRILKESHESPWESAHAGSARLFHKLAARFYWPRMWTDVVEFTRTCDVCQKIKADKRGPKGKLRPHAIPLLPFEVVTLDLITGLPRSDGFDAVLVIVDKLTKFVQYVPTLSNLKQEGFAKLFVEHVALKYGIPQQMIADRDARWAKAFWASVAKHLGLSLLLSTSHHPQTDGQTEKANDTLEVALRAYTAGSRGSWAKWLGILAMAHNSTPHSSTNYSPFFLLHGYSPRTNETAIDPVPRGINRFLTHSAAAMPFINELEVHRTRARDALARAQARQAKAYNTGRRDEEFEEGDEVLVNPHSLELVEVHGTGRKLVQRRIGPFPISEKINSVVYRLHIPPEYRMHPVVNIQHLTKYYRDDGRSDRAKLPELRELSTEEEYEVEKLVGHRYNPTKRRREYLVRWKGYGPEHDTFEPELALRNAFAKLREYKASIRSQEA
jgi:hypothetical protein